MVRAEQIRPLPDGVSTEHGALAEPLAVALHAVHRAGDVRGRDVVVNGAGPIGSLVVAAAKYRGAASVIAADICPTPRWRSPRPWAPTRSATSPPADTLPEDAELVFEASGAPAALGSVLRATARGGTLVQVGNLPGTAVSAVLGDLVTREITWVGAYRFVEEISDALAGDARRPRRVAADHPPVRPRSMRPQALAVAARPDQRQQQGHAAARLGSDR